MILLSSIISQFKSLFFEKYKKVILPSHEKALSAMEMCRTQSAPHMLACCTNNECSHKVYVPHSCGHRHCPHCQNHESQRWIENQLQKKVPAQYYMLTFTIPNQLRDITWKNQKLMYSLLFLCVKEVLKTFTKNDKKLGGDPGFTMVMHTHARNLAYHPHTHIVMPGASVDKKNKLWKVKTGEYIFNHKALAKVFRAKLLKEMVDNKLHVPKKCPQKWVVDCKNVGKGDKALLYLGKYLYRGVIQEKNILKCENGIVTFRYFHSKTNTYQTRCVPGEKFIWLIIQHVFPKGFRRVRDYGFFHSCSKQLIKVLQYILKCNPSTMSKKIKKRAKIICPFCGNDMKIVRTQIVFSDVCIS
jgi:hypothetical protein